MTLISLGFFSQFYQKNSVRQEIIKGLTNNVE